MPVYDPAKHGAWPVIPELLEEQERDAAIMASHGRFCDFSEPGAVKTLTALRAVERSKAQQLLVICPPIALRMWTRTAAAFFKTDRVAFINSSKNMPKLTGFNVVVTTYAIATNPVVRSKLQAWKPGAAIIDESHALKSLAAQRTIAIYGKRALMLEDALLHGIPFVFALTGTPVVRHNDDVYPTLKALHPRVLEQHFVSSEAAFNSMFCVTALRSFHPRQRPKTMVIESKNTEHLREIIFGTPLAVRRLVTDIEANMPPVSFTPIDVGYERTAELTEATRAIKAPELYEEDTPATATVRRMLGAAKAKDVARFAVDRYEEQGKRPILILFWHHEAMKEIKLQLLYIGLHYRIRVIDGSTSAANKSKYEDEFNAGEVDFLIGQIASMGVSLNLQHGGSTAIFAEPDWSPSTIEQAFRRLWRFGQERHVRVYMCYADHPADDAAASVLFNKSTNIDLLTTSSSAVARKGMFKR